MARYKPIDMVDHYHGKICSHSDTYFQKRGDTLCTGRICNPRDLSKKPYSPEEIAFRHRGYQGTHSRATDRLRNGICVSKTETLRHSPWFHLRPGVRQINLIYEPIRLCMADLKNLN